MSVVSGVSTAFEDLPRLFVSSGFGFPKIINVLHNISLLNASSFVFASASNCCFSSVAFSNVAIAACASSVAASSFIFASASNSANSAFVASVFAASSFFSASASNFANSAFVASAVASNCCFSSVAASSLV